MSEILLKIIIISAVIAIPAQSIVLSLSAGRSSFRELFRHKSILIRYTLIMFVIIPLVAVGFSYIFGKFSEIWIAILIISLTPASPGMIKNLNKHTGDYKISITWMIMTIFLSIIFIPFMLLILESIFQRSIDLGVDEVVIKILIMFVIPILIGFFITKYFSKYVSGIKKILVPLSKIALLTLVICLLILAVPMMISKGAITFLLILAFIVVALAIAHFMGSPEKLFGPILPYSIILRLPAPAIVLMQLNNTVDRHLPIVITYTILGFIVMAIYYKIFFGSKGRRSEK